MRGDVATGFFRKASVAGHGSAKRFTIAAQPERERARDVVLGPAPKPREIRGTCSRIAREVCTVAVRARVHAHKRGTRRSVAVTCHARIRPLRRRG